MTSAKAAKSETILLRENNPIIQDCLKDDKKYLFRKIR